MPVTDIILKNKDKDEAKNEMAVSDILIMPGSETVQNIIMIIRLLDTSKNHQQFKAVNEEIALKQQSVPCNRHQT